MKHKKRNHLLFCSNNNKKKRRRASIIIIECRINKIEINQKFCEIFKRIIIKEKKKK
jgi:hypothetical protein